MSILTVVSQIIHGSHIMYLCLLVCLFVSIYPWGLSAVSFCCLFSMPLWIDERVPLVHPATQPSRRGFRGIGEMIRIG